MRNEELE